MSLKQSTFAGGAKHNDAKDGCRNKYLTIVGCFLILMNNGLTYFWGNMSVYCTSYFVSVLNVTSGVQSPWVFSCFTIMWTLGILVSGSISGRIGRRFTILLGAVVFNTGVFCSYFSVQNSLAALTVTIGAVPGLGIGLMDGSGLQLGIDWEEKRVGLITCILQGSFSFGAIFINQVITLYTNPNNLTPNWYLSPTKYFTQKEVLDKVPSMFLVVGCYTSCWHLIGFFMLREKPASSQADEVSDETSQNATPSQLDEVNYNAGEHVTSLTQRNYNKQRADRCNLKVKEPISNSPATTERDKLHYKSVANSKLSEYKFKEADDDGCDLKMQESSSEIAPKTVTDKLSASTTGNNRDYTFREVLKTKSFYVCWMCFLPISMTVMLSNTYYKTFGQVWIKDDYFMTNIATVMNVGNAMMSTITGFLVDCFGAKNCTVLVSGSMALVLFWYYFTPMLNQWLYMVTVLVFVCQAGSMFATYSAFPALLFGKKHFSTNYGMLMTSHLIFNLISPHLVGFMLTTLGWFAMYTFTGVILALSLLPMIFCIPNV